MTTYHQHGETAGVMAAKLAAPVTVSGMTLAGVQLEHVVLWATLFYTILLIVHKCWTMWREWKAERDATDD